MKPNLFDVIVVGLDPAGSMTARVLAERGIRVLGLDRARFPRHKPCAFSPEASVPIIIAPCPA